MVAPLTRPPSGLDDNVSEFSKTVSGSLVEVSASVSVSRYPAGGR